MAPLNSLAEQFVDQMKQKQETPWKKTAPLDSRFPNQNQARYCYQMYLDFHRCVKKRGEKYEPCQYFKHAYTVMCPSFWLEQWDAQVEEGRFAGRI